LRDGGSEIDGGGGSGMGGGGGAAALEGNERGTSSFSEIDGVFDIGSGASDREVFDWSRPRM